MAWSPAPAPALTGQIGGMSVDPAPLPDQFPGRWFAVITELDGLSARVAPRYEIPVYFGDPV